MDLEDVALLAYQIKSGYKKLKRGKPGDAVPIPPITLDLGDFDVVLEGAPDQTMQLRRK